MATDVPQFVTYNDYYKWRVTQDNDIARELKRLWERLDSVAESHGRKFDIVNQKFDIVNQKFDIVNQKFDIVDQKFEIVDQKLDSLDQKFDRLEVEVRSIQSRLRNGDASRLFAIVEKIPVLRQGQIHLPSDGDFPTRLRGWCRLMEPTEASLMVLIKLVHFYDIDSFRSWPEIQRHLQKELQSDAESDCDSESDLKSNLGVEWPTPIHSITLGNAVIAYPLAALHDVMRCVGLKYDLVAKAQADYQRFRMQKPERKERKRQRQTDNSECNAEANKKGRTSERESGSPSRHSNHSPTSKSPHHSLDQSSKSTSSDATWGDYVPIGKSVNGSQLSISTASDEHKRGIMRGTLSTKSPSHLPICYPTRQLHLSSHRRGSNSDKSLDSSSSGSATDVIPEDEFRDLGPIRPNTSK